MTTTGKATRQLSSMEGTVTDIGYDSYATAWRYLGVYTDCGGSGSSSWWGGGRRLADDDDDGGSGGDCEYSRKLLWAAVRIRRQARLSFSSFAYS